MRVPFKVTVGTSGVPEKECHAGPPLSFPWPDSEVKLSLRQLNGELGVKHREL